jgi:hypothetical protein
LVAPNLGGHLRANAHSLIGSVVEAQQDRHVALIGQTDAIGRDLAFFEVGNLLGAQLGASIQRQNVVIAELSIEIGDARNHRDQTVLLGGQSVIGLEQVAHQTALAISIARRDHPHLANAKRIPS